MKFSYTYILIGLLLLLFGVWDNEGKYVPPTFSFIVGSCSIFYGVYLYAFKNSLINIPEKWQVSGIKVNAIFLIFLSQILIRLDKYIPYVKSHFALDILFALLGFVLLFYGIWTLYKQRKWEIEQKKVKQLKDKEIE
ncbi:MAG: hypothetical protein P1U56_05870 [Saprospiraceae bacterium]|nr:hypothetical protein [Saprospiraceae bacterium]